MHLLNDVLPAATSCASAADADDPMTTSALSVSLSDVQGRIVKSWTFQKQGAVWDQALDVSNLPAGNYFIRLQSGAYKISRQFVKK